MILVLDFALLGGGALVFLGLALGNVALLVHLSEKAIRLEKAGKTTGFSSTTIPSWSQLIRALVLDNEELGISKPFYVSEHEADE